MYNIGTVTTTANSTKLVGTGTKWKENINLVLPMQMIQIQIDNTVHNNSIHSIQSNTELTLNFPLPTAQAGAKYVIFTTTMDSISAAANAIVAMNVSNVQFSDILNRIMTETGVIDVKLPDGTVRKTRTEAERDKLLDGKQPKGDYADGNLYRIGNNKLESWVYTPDKTKVFNVNNSGLSGVYDWNTNRYLWGFSADGVMTAGLIPVTCGGTNAKNSVDARKNLGALGVGDYGIGLTPATATNITSVDNIDRWDLAQGFYKVYNESKGVRPIGVSADKGFCLLVSAFSTATGGAYVTQTAFYYSDTNSETYRRSFNPRTATWTEWSKLYSTANTTKDSNGNLKVASPIVKVFADHIETNDESEGVEMEHLGVGHYLIKGVVGFNADGAWGINNGFVIPQDHNGKNMILIDYEVRPNGDIEVFVFHQQNADMPERFQNKRIKLFDEEGAPVYFENYEPCDVPESRWIDMRVEMPPNSLYNQKQAEAERLAKLEAERLAQEEAKRAAEEAERADQEAAEQLEQQ
ncbi:pyocin knob domain-containing protein [Providencia rettgeri]|uniref:pyocin knob domain-containing protein n=1 Tax=Providencia rettgeri TaxID=587 RepID=UPI001F506A40|nr:pyocin knob domain-containing protein [Providencia rettgeri]